MEHRFSQFKKTRFPVLSRAQQLVQLATSTDVDKEEDNSHNHLLSQQDVNILEPPTPELDDIPETVARNDDDFLDKIEAAIQSLSKDAAFREGYFQDKKDYQELLPETDDVPVVLLPCDEEFSEMEAAIQSLSTNPAYGEGSLEEVEKEDGKVGLEGDRLSEEEWQPRSGSQGGDFNDNVTAASDEQPEYIGIEEEPSNQDSEEEVQENGRKEVNFEEGTSDQSDGEWKPGSEDEKQLDDIDSEEENRENQNQNFEEGELEDGRKEINFEEGTSDQSDGEWKSGSEDEEQLDDIDSEEENRENQNQNFEEGELEDRRNGIEAGKKKRRRIANMSEWHDVKNKKLRENGKSYVGWTKKKNEKGKRGADRTERVMGPRCTSKHCKKITTRNCDDVPESMRQLLFDHFWSQLSWDQKKIYILSMLMVASVKKRVGKGPVSRRSGTLKYTLRGLDGKVFQVCKNLFLATFGIGEWTVSNWVRESSSNAGMSPAQEVRNAERRKLRDHPINEKKVFLHSFLDSLPKLPSHYCRASTSKLYLEPTLGNSFSDIYREYCRQWEQHAERAEDIEVSAPLSKFSFDCAVKEKNIAFQPPKKDMCDTCIEYEVGHLDKDDYQKHITAKNRARAEKQKDKEDGENKTCIVLTQDVQAVKVSPMLNASALYYRTKLCNHNFTVYNINTHHCKCYWFSECEADLTANTFSTCVIDYLTSMNVSSASLPIIIWSDGCGYQNRNAVLSNALLSYSVEYKVTVFQKFLHKGHTQMEVDSVHSNIERKLKHTTIYLPSDYIKCTLKARDPPYEAKEVTHNFIKNFSLPIVYKSIRPGRNAKDPVVNDIKVLKYTPDGLIQAKLDFDGPYIDLPRPRNTPKVPRIDDFLPAHESRLKIPYRKWVHLQELKSVISTDCHPFYDGLPHETPPSKENEVNQCDQDEDVAPRPKNREKKRSQSKKKNSKSCAKEATPTTSKMNLHKKRSQQSEPGCSKLKKIKLSKLQ